MCDDTVTTGLVKTSKEADDTNTDGQPNGHTTQEAHAVRRRDRRITRKSVSVDFVHQYNMENEVYRRVDKPYLAALRGFVYVQREAAWPRGGPHECEG
jgi:hypothetical protein